MNSRRFTRLFCPCVTLATGGAGALGWIFHWRPFTHTLTRFIPMAPLTADVLLLLGGSVVLFVCFPQSRAIRLTLRTVASGIILLNLAKLLEFFSHTHFGFEEALQAHTSVFGLVQTGRISPIAAIFFIALAIAAFSVRNRTPLAGTLAVAVFLNNNVVLLGYLYGTPLLYGGHIIPMALSTSLAFAFLSFGLLSLTPAGIWPLRFFTGTSTKARLLRTFLPISFATIILDGTFYRLGAGLNPALRSALSGLVAAPLMSVFVSRVAVWIGSSIDHSESERRKAQAALHEAHVELHAAYDSTLEGWARALELRDKVTEGHCRRVMELTVTLARAMGVAEEELVHFRRGAFLHDIGKMGIPDHVLCKPGPLTEDERLIMRQHPEYGLKILSPIAYLRPTLDIPYCHHEFWDGGGYPRGLKGEEIPLAARIFSVVDVWDALRSRRPYKEGWSPDAVRTHIRSLSGTQLDPQVVDAFLSLDIIVSAEDAREPNAAAA